jgi:integrase
MKSVAKVPYLLKLGSRYYFRRAVPKDLQPVICKPVFKEALGTSDHKRAAEIVRIRAVEVDAIFKAARFQIQVSDRECTNDERSTDALPISELEIRQLVMIWFSDAQKRRDERYFSKDQFDDYGEDSGFYEGYDEVEEDEESEVDETLDEIEATTPDPLEEIGGDINSFQNLSDSNSLAIVQNTANQLLETKGLELDFNSDGYQLLCGLIRRGYLQGARRAYARIIENRSNEVFDVLFAEPANDQVVPSIPLKELVEIYMNDPDREHILEKSKKADRAKFTVLIELLGEETPVSAITRKDCREARAAILNLPKNSKQKFPKMSALEASRYADVNDIEKISKTTVNGHIGRLSTLLKYAVREDYLGKNPAEELRIRTEGSKKEARHPFSNEQLEQIFNSPLYTGCQNDGLGYAKPGNSKPKRGKFWVPLIGLFTGMRLNEICQLEVSDIEKLDGVDVILIRKEGEGDDKKLKTRSAKRAVPIHPELKKMGLLKHVKKMKDKGKVRLFPDLSKGKTGYYSDPFEKWFGRFQDKAGAKTKKTSFHSFRHTFRDRLREANVNQDAVRALGGWKDSGGAEENYGSGLKAGTLYREISKIEFSDLDLSHLYDDA